MAGGGPNGAGGGSSSVLPIIVDDASVNDDTYFDIETKATTLPVSEEYYGGASRRIHLNGRGGDTGSQFDDDLSDTIEREAERLNEPASQRGEGGIGAGSKKTNRRLSHSSIGTQSATKSIWATTGA
jgi:hypothetical protein